jgi:lysyl-tRNA synthetase class 2
MKRVRVGSSAIASVSYKEDKRTLDVQFREGDTYRYIHVPKFVYHELLSAESAGAFWNQIKDNYEFTRLDKTNRKQ